MYPQDEIKTQAKDAVREVLEERDDDGRTIIEREVETAVDDAGDHIVARLTKRFVLPAIGLTVAIVGLYYALYYQVHGNSVALDQGGRYTQEEHDQYALSQAERDEEQDRRLNEASQERKEQYQNLNAKLDSMNALLIQIIRDGR